MSALDVDNFSRLPVKLAFSGAIRWIVYIYIIRVVIRSYSYLDLCEAVALVQCLWRDAIYGNISRTRWRLLSYRRSQSIYGLQVQSALRSLTATQITWCLWYGLVGFPSPVLCRELSQCTSFQCGCHAVQYWYIVSVTSSGSRSCHCYWLLNIWTSWFLRFTFTFSLKKIALHAAGLGLGVRKS